MQTFKELIFKIVRSARAGKATAIENSLYNCHYNAINSPASKP